MNPYEFGAADSEENDSRMTHRAGARVIASLFVAFFAYLGLALGGGINLAARADAEAFSSGKDTQPLYLALRDPVRGTIIADQPGAVNRAAGAGCGAFCTCSRKDTPK